MMLASTDVRLIGQMDGVGGFCCVTGLLCGICVVSKKGADEGVCLVNSEGGLYHLDKTGSCLKL